MEVQLNNCNKHLDEMAAFQVDVVAEAMEVGGLGT